MNTNLPDKDEIVDDKEISRVEQSLAIEETQRYAGKYITSDTFNPTDVLNRKQRLDSVNKDIKRICGDAGYQTYLQRTANKRSQEDFQFSRMANAQMLHTLDVASKKEQETDCNNLIEEDTMDTSATMLEMAHGQQVAKDDFDNKLSKIGTTREAELRAIELDDTLTEEEKEERREAVDVAVAAQNTVIGATGVTEYNAIMNSRKTTALNQIGKLTNRVNDCYKRQYAYGKQMSRLHESCDADGQASARNYALRYFKERIARGHIVEVMSMLDAIEKKSDENFKESRKLKDANGNDVLDAKGNPQYTQNGTYNPSDMLFCRHEDFRTLRESANAALVKAARYRRMQDAKMAEDFKLIDADIRIKADKLSTQPVLDMAKMEELIKATDDLLAKGFADADKTSAHLTSIIKAAERKYNKAQKDSEKLETEADFQRELDSFNESLKLAAPVGFFSQNGNIKSEQGNMFGAQYVDGKNRMILLIRNGQSRGILKGDHWNKELKRLESDRAGDDYLYAMNAISSCGISVDEKASKDLRKTLGKSQSDITEELGDSAYKSLWTEDDSGRLKLRNSKYMMYKWHDSRSNTDYKMSGDELNQLLTVVSAWQKRHVNPSPIGEQPVELRNLISDTLRRSARKKVIEGFFSDDYSFGFSDIELVGRNIVEKYFSPVEDRGTKKVYNISKTYERDMDVLKSVMLRRELPTMSQLRKAIEARANKQGN